MINIMKLAAQSKAGGTTTLEMVEPVQMVGGEHLWRLEDATGAEHYFSPDGYYDGSGRTLVEAQPVQLMTITDAIKISKETGQVFQRRGSSDCGYVYEEGAIYSDLQVEDLMADDWEVVMKRE